MLHAASVDFITATSGAWPPDVMSAPLSGDRMNNDDLHPSMKRLTILLEKLSIAVIK